MAHIKKKKNLKKKKRPSDLTKVTRLQGVKPGFQRVLTLIPTAIPSYEMPGR